MALITELRSSVDGSAQPVLLITLTKEFFVSDEVVKITYSVTAPVSFDPARTPEGFTMSANQRTLSGTEVLNASPKPFSHPYRLRDTAGVAIVALVAEVQWPVVATDSREVDIVTGES